MTNLKGKVKERLGNLYGLRTWIEYGFRQCKQELGWHDYRLTNFPDIEKWWEINLSVYLMVSLKSQALGLLHQDDSPDSRISKSPVDFSKHQRWNHEGG